MPDGKNTLKEDLARIRDDWQCAAHHGVPLGGAVGTARLLDLLGRIVNRLEALEARS